MTERKIFDSMMQREQRRQEKIIEFKVNELRPKQVWSSLENDKIYDSDTVIKYVRYYWN